MFSIIIFLCFIYDTGTDLDSHGGYNRILLFLFMGLHLMIILFFINFGYFLCKKPLVTVMIIALIIVLGYMRVNYVVKHSCEGWEIGFKGSLIYNPKESICKITPPQICYYKIFNGVFDLSRILGDTCDNMGTNKLSNMEKYLPDKSARILGYPRTENWDIFPSSTHGKIQKRAMREMVNMEDNKISKEIKDKIEVTTNFYKNPPEVTIDLKRDETLVKSRAEIFKKYEKKVLARNVLYIFIDSLSRNNFKLKLPKFYEWIGQFYNLEENLDKNGGENTNAKSTDPNFETFQFLKYHGVGRYTALNMVPAFFGVYNIYFAGKYFLIDYKDRGYITGQSLNFCGREVFDIDGGAIERMKWTSYDHEMQSFFCDGNFTPYDSPNPIMMGTNSIRKRCMYNKNTTFFSLEYMRQFFEKYKSEPKFFRLGLVDGHEGTTEVIKYTDDLLVEFFNKFKADGHLDDTLIFIHTDHGFSMPGPFSLLELDDYLHEVVLPSYFMIAPKSLKNFDKIRKNLKYNENALITPFTTYNNLIAILNDRQSLMYAMEDELDVFNHKIRYEKRICRNTFYNDDYFYNKDFMCRCRE